MKRALLIVLLSFGTVAGYASGIHHLRHGGHGCGDHRSRAWSSCPCHQTPPPPVVPAQPKAPETPPAP